MRLLVVSDVHGRLGCLLDAIDRQPEARYVFCLGDGAEQYEQAAELYPDRQFRVVAGNCDTGAPSLPLTGEEQLLGRRIFYTHGHLQQVKYGDGELRRQALARQADLVLFGHTHQPLQEYEDGLYLFNPGSLGYSGSYGVVDITSTGQIMTILMHI